MPIRVGSLGDSAEEKHESDPARIVEFLDSTPSQAYTVGELAEDAIGFRSVERAKEAEASDRDRMVQNAMSGETYLRAMLEILLYEDKIKCTYTEDGGDIQPFFHSTKNSQ